MPADCVHVPAAPFWLRSAAEHVSCCTMVLAPATAVDGSAGAVDAAGDVGDGKTEDVTLLPRKVVSVVVVSVEVVAVVVVAVVVVVVLVTVVDVVVTHVSHSTGQSARICSPRAHTSKSTTKAPASVRAQQQRCFGRGQNPRYTPPTPGRPNCCRGGGGAQVVLANVIT